MEKKCSGCGEVKSFTEFGKDKQKSDGLTSRCKPCIYAKNRAYANSDKGRESTRKRTAAWRQRNPEHGRKAAKERTERYRQAPLPVISKSCTTCGQVKAARFFNRDVSKKDGLCSACKACQQSYFAQHQSSKAEYLKQWYQDNPERVRANGQRRRARKKSAAGSFTAEQIKELMVKQKKKCAACATSLTKAYHIDHIVPLSRGGGGDISNIQLLCPHCNLSKGSKDPVDYMQSIGKLL